MSDTPTKMQHSFTPDAGNARALRDAFGRFATGVTVVTCTSSDGPICVTANSFSSLSLEPPLVMWAVSRAARRYRHFRHAEHFAVHVLAAHQSDLCFTCSQDAHALRHIRHGLNDHGVPLLPDCLARFECSQHAYHDAGDHVIVVGKVAHVGMQDGEALAFFSGKYGQFAPS